MINVVTFYFVFNNNRKLLLCGKDALIRSLEWMKNGLKLLAVNILLIFRD